MSKRPSSGIIKVRNDQVFTQFSKSYEDTLDVNNYTPDLILKVGKEKYEYNCHRLMLASASDFLRMVLGTATPGTIPVILLPDISYTVIDYVLLYVYYGEVQVPEEKYADFVEACKLLEMKAPIDQVYQFYNDDDDDFVSENGDEDIDIGNAVNEEFLEDSETSEDAATERWKYEYGVPPAPRYAAHYEGGMFKGYKDFKGSSKFETRKIDATPQIKRKAQECLILSVQRAYNAVGVQLTPQLQAQIKASKLIIENEKLQRGTTVCGFCDYTINILYRVSRSTGFIVYSNHSLKAHMMKKHPSHLKLRK